MANKQTKPPMQAFDIYKVVGKPGNERKGEKLDTVFFQAGTETDYVWRCEYLNWLGCRITVTKQRNPNRG